MNEHKLNESVRKHLGLTDIIDKAIKEYQKGHLSVKQLIAILNDVNHELGRYVPGEVKVKDDDDWHWTELFWFPLFLFAFIATVKFVMFLFTIKFV